MFETLDIEQIRECLESDCELVLFEKTDSTNDQARLKVKQGCTLPLACFAEEQTQGRGRRGKVWVSPPGSSIYLSLIWKFDLPVNELGSLSLAIGVAVARVLKKLGLKNVGLKWPNDVLVDDKKIAGILIEATQLTSSSTTAIIGIGLNYKLPADLPVKPDQPWTDIISSLTMASPDELNISRNNAAGLLLHECMVVCEVFLLAKAALMLEYQDQYDVCLWQDVDIHQEDGSCRQGQVIGFEETGEIRIRIGDEEQLFNSADISLRKASNANN